MPCIFIPIDIPCCSRTPHFFNFLRGGPQGLPFPNVLGPPVYLGKTCFYKCYHRLKGDSVWKTHARKNGKTNDTCSPETSKYNLNSKLSDRTTNTEHRPQKSEPMLLSVSMFPICLCFFLFLLSRSVMFQEHYINRNRNRNKFTTQAIKDGQRTVVC